MGGEQQGVEEWLPQGVSLRVPVPADVAGAKFTVNGTAPSRSEPHAEANRATVDLNAVDFEELIALGISVGQAARFVSQRERRGGIAAISELDGFYGLAPGVRDILRWNGYVQG